MNLKIPCLVLLLAAAGPAPAIDGDTQPIDCANCAEWNREQPPFRLFGNSYYVGTRGLSAVLIAGSEGLVLLDAGLPQSAPLIAAHIEALGFKLSDLRWILNSHAHYDHAGGIAALARLSGARVGASAAGAAALEAGTAPADDPQFAFGDAMRFPRVTEVRAFADSERLRLGDIAITAVYTPGHTPGGTSWHWRACESTGECRDLIYADSLNAVSAPDFRYSDEPSRVARFRASIERIEQLSCDLVVSVHPEFVRLFRYGAKGEVSLTPESDRKHCSAYAQGARAALEERLLKEKIETPRTRGRPRG